MADEKDPMDRFEGALRAWAARPTGQPPAAAARQIVARIEGRRARAPRLHRGWAWTAAGLTAAAGIAVLLRVGEVPRASLSPGAPSRAAGVAPLRPDGRTLADGQVLIWLDSETPLYMNFAPSAGAPHPGGGS